MSKKNSSDTIWDRTSDLQMCSIAPLSLCHRGPLGCCPPPHTNPTATLFTRVTSNCPRTKNRKSDWKCYQCSERVSRVHSVKTSQNNMQQLHMTIIIQKIFIHISVLNLSFQKFWVCHFIQSHKECKI